MKNIIDKIKDILYDGTEYILMVAIIAIIALVLNWRLEGLFAMDVESSDKDLETYTESIVDEFSEYMESNKDEIATEEETEETGETEDTETKGEIVNIIIPSGTLPNEIGNILVSNGLIDSRSQFIEKVVEMGVETKLKSGTFKIAKGSSLEEIINILTK